ncbi:MAG TPA: hypothetical protein VFP58_08400 [Candidatus Eisenbacteria bacterium]|nr:hypothetical protein [Candidatus Eisenbacteria bacterium]
MSSSPFHPGGFELATSSPTEQERLEQDLLHTNRLIRVLRAKIHRSGNSGAQDRFVEAMKREREAREAFEESQFARSSRLTLEARTLAREAAVMVGPLEEDPAYVARTIDRAGEALTLALEVFDQGASPSIWKRYNGLKNDLARAHGLHKQGDTREAYRMALLVRDSVLDLLTEAEDLPIPASTASKALRRVEQALSRASKDLGPKPKEEAAVWQRQASGHLSKAKQSYGRKDYRSTMIYSKLALRVLDQAVTAQRNGVKSAAS